MNSLSVQNGQIGRFHLMKNDNLSPLMDGLEIPKLGFFIIMYENSGIERFHKHLRNALLSPHSSYGSELRLTAQFINIYEIVRQRAFLSYHLPQVLNTPFARRPATRRK